MEIIRFDNSQAAPQKLARSALRIISTNTSKNTTTLLQKRQYQIVLWTVKYADIPQLTFIILLHRAATTACTIAVAKALEEAFEEIAVTAVVVTFSRKTFLRIARGHLLP